MSATTDLHRQLAQRLFGWTWNPVLQLWEDAAQGLWVAADLPAYTTAPAATALVWQWVEQQRGLEDWEITFAYWAGKVACRLARVNGVYTLAHEDGSTWQEALCRAALALAEMLQQGEGL